MDRRTFLKLLRGSAIGVGVAGFGASTYGVFFETEKLSLEKVDVSIKSLPSAFEGFRIVLLSDLHLHPFTRLELIRRTREMVNGLKPDLIVLAGDYVYREVAAIHALAPVLGQLDARHGVFAVLGNHDVWKGPDVVAEAIRKAGITLLMNQGVSIGRGSQQIYLAGVDSSAAGLPDVREAFKAKRAEDVTLLLAHEPDTILSFQKSVPISLQLSGHSHGGQIRIPGLGPLVLPPLAQVYSQGLYRSGDSQLYVTRGIGTIHVPLRIDCQPEITEITLRAA